MRLIIIASRKLDAESSTINLSAQVKVMFSKIKVGEINKSSCELSEQCHFNIYFSQTGGFEEKKDAFIQENRINNDGTIEDCQRIVSAVTQYVCGSSPDNFREQIQECPASWDEEYISYGDEGKIAYLWNTQQ